MLHLAHRAALGRAKFFTSPDADWLPVVFFRDAGSTLHIVGVSLHEDQKDEAVDAIAALLKNQQAVAAALVLSSWMTLTPGLRPSQAPDRSEILVFHAADPEVDLVRFAAIERHPDKPPTLGPLHEVPGDRVAGRFPDALRRGIR